MTPREELTACPLHASIPPDDGLEAHIENCPACLAALDQALANQVRELRAACPLLPRRAAEQPECPAPTPPRVADYEILGEIGRGGLGVVYRAQQSKLGRPVAVKVMLGGGHAGERDRERLRREARILAKLSHPNLVAVHDAGVGEDGLPYLVMELVEGTTLSQRLAGGAMAAREAAALLRTLALAVQYAHEQGVIHRDLKAANVLLCRRASCQLALVPEQAGSLLYDGAKIADFGLARLLDDDTQSSAVMGTPNYIAPEQVAGVAASPMVDVYGLGAILYECLTARPPYQGANKAETLAQVLGDDEPLPPRRLRPELPPDLETICLKCLRKEPWRRYSAARELADDLGRFLEGRPIAARPPSAWSHAWRACRRHPWTAGLGASLILGGVVGLVVITTLWRVADGHRRREATARDQAEEDSRQWRLALAEFVRLAEEGTFRVDPSRLALSRQIAQRYRDLLRRSPGDEALLLEAARMLTRLAELQANAYRWEDALPTFRQARDRWGEVSRRFPMDRGYRVERALCLTRLAWVAGEAGVAEEEALRQAAELWAAVGGAGLPVRHKVRILQTHHSLAGTHSSHGRLAEARGEFRRAREWIADFRREANDPAAFLTEEVLTWHHEATTLVQQHDREAVACWLQAYQLSRAANPVSRHHGEICLGLLGRHDIEPYYSEGVALVEQDLQAAERRVQNEPNDLRGARWVCLHADRLVNAHVRAARPDQARAIVERLDKHLTLMSRRLSRDDAETIQFIEPAMRAAELWLECREVGKGMRLCREVGVLLRRWSLKATEPSQRRRLANLAHRVAIVLRKGGLPSEALAFLNWATPLVETPSGRDFDSLAEILGDFCLYEQAGKCHSDLGQPGQATDAWRRGNGILREALASRPDWLVIRERLASRCVALARHHRKHGQDDDARSCLAEGRNLGPRDSETRRMLDETERLLAAVR